MTVTRIYLGIGSNIDREINIHNGLIELQSQYGELQVSPIYESKAFGFEGDDFFNLVVGLNTELSIDDLETGLREMEYQFGRKRNETRYSSRTLDIDLLLYADLVCDMHELPRIDITKYAFVLKPLCDIEPDLIHPAIGETISSLWQNFDMNDQTIKKITLNIAL